MRLAAVAVIVLVVAGALAFVFLGGDSNPKYRSRAEADRAAAAVAVAKCDAAMSTLDADLEAASRDASTQRRGNALADRLGTCTKAHAAAQRARAVSKNDKQLEVAMGRIANHLERINGLSSVTPSAGSAAGSN